MLPLSYQGFGFTAILLMVALLSVVEGVKYIRHRLQRHSEKAVQHETVEIHDTVRDPSKRPTDPRV